MPTLCLTAGPDPAGILAGTLEGTLGARPGQGLG